MKNLRFLLTTLLFIGVDNIKAQQLVTTQGAIITGELDKSKLCDTVRLILNEQEYYDFQPTPLKALEIYTAPVVNGKFTLYLPYSLDYPVHFKIDSNMRFSMANRYSYLSDYILDRGDSINIKIRKVKLQFSGKGSEKLRAKYAVDTATLERLSSSGRYATATGSVLRDLYEDSIISGTTYAIMHSERDIKSMQYAFKIKLAELDKHKEMLPKHIYQLMYVDLLASGQSPNFTTFSYFLGFLEDETKFLYIKSLFDTLPVPSDSIPVDVRIRSPYYTRYLWQKERIGYLLENRKTDAVDMYHELKGKYPGRLNEILLTYHLIRANKSTPNNSELINDALETQIKIVGYRHMLENLLRSKAGTAAYDFALPDLDGNTVRLSDFKGKVVFLDFYYRGCAPCRSYYQNVVSKVKKVYKDRKDLVFVAISIDKTKEEWLEGIRSEQYSSYQAINVNTGELGANHPVVKKFSVVGYPTPILIDRDGNIFNRNKMDLRTTTESLMNQIDRALVSK